ncbi:ATP-dependent DNA helicase [Rhodovibrio sodomensis]|uniref:DNA 3'-5' helicase n=1 Tax=Rhodovibrio sodomensis TaxID=1088 RepID=A0ABS1DBN6_9PROT|nr:ATP-dependent helicase [Rhodovibrio sodomensis]MBK1667634.1 ATP-dependent DNA helicase [Rhodovibrio sodomensis]
MTNVELASGNSPFDSLNQAQREAVEHGLDQVQQGRLPGPVLIIAGAGSGKTRTLTARVARLILAGADPNRILMMTFTRRAAAEMTRRALGIVSDALGTSASTRELSWSGTFHAIAQRLLRLHAEQIGLSQDFSVLDRSDAEDLMNVVREDLEFSKSEKRFPKKGQCLAIYSHTINARQPLQAVLDDHFPQYAEWADELKQLFRAYVEAKQDRDLLDYDDLLLYWADMMHAEGVGAEVRKRFDYVLVDEYQDTNVVQADILRGLAPNGDGLTVVGDDAQSIYSFRAATIRNILDFPQMFDPPARVIALEENYRSTQPILDASNHVIAQSSQRYAKQLFSRRESSDLPKMVTTRDEQSQVDYVVERVMANREAGIDLREQAVLVRAGYHSGALEIELARRNIPFVKYGGLKFMEAAHIKDVISLLRWAENIRDQVAGFRVLQLLPGIGPGNARRAFAQIERAQNPVAAMAGYKPPKGAQAEWQPLVEVMGQLRDRQTDWTDQPGLGRRWYGRYIERLHENPRARMNDLEQMERIAQTYPNRARFLSEVALDPPDTSGDEAGEPLIDDDWLIISTIHSSKGQEYQAVYVLNVVDGCIPSDMATGSDEGVEEERRLLYVAMTRAKDQLHLIQPQRFYRHNQPRHGDGHVVSPTSRFLPPDVLDNFEQVGYGAPAGQGDAPATGTERVDLKSRMRGMWD